MRARTIILSLLIAISLLFANWYISEKRIISYYHKKLIKGQNGLTGFYYSNTERFGCPAFVRTDPLISFDSNSSLDFQKDYFSVYWTGLIYIERTGRYKFYTASDDSSQISIDNTIVVHNDGIHPKKEASGRVYLRKGYHVIELLYNEYYGEACIELLWRPPTGVKEIIPAKHHLPVSDKFDIHKADKIYIDMFRLNLFIVVCFILFVTRKNITNFITRHSAYLNWPILLIISVGAYLRFSNINLMEFKTDESVALLMIRDFVTFKKIPLVGLMSGVGIYNPPLFIYLLAIPSLISCNPLFIASFVAVTNIISIYLCYLIGRKFHSEAAGLLSSALYCVSPWAVVFSRKIWSQDLLPVFTAALLYIMLSWVIKAEKKKLPLAIFLFACILQLHYSSLAFIPLLLLLYILFRPDMDIRQLSFGILLSLALFVPFMVYEMRNGFVDLTEILHISGPPDPIRSFHSLINIFISALNNINLYNFGGLIGDYANRLYNPYTMAFASAERRIFIAGLLYVGVKAVTCGRKNVIYPFLLLWFSVPIIIWGIAKVSPRPHYTIILYPVQFLIMGIFLSDVFNSTARKWIKAILALIIVSVGYTQILFSIHLYRIIGACNTVGVDYGLPYKYKKDAIKYISKTAEGAEFSVSSTGIQDDPMPKFSFETLHPEYWCLLRLFSKDIPLKTSSEKYHFWISGSGSVLTDLKHLEYIKSTSFGCIWVHQFRLKS